MKGEKFMKLTILGIQGCGKGTQAKRIAKEYGIPHISTGDIFRKAMAEQTPLGVEAQGYVNSGNLVPDSLTINLVKERVAQEDCANGYILDGFPRNMAQAEAFEAQLDKAIYIDVDEDTVIKRIKARRTCEKCGEIYSTETYDKAECSKCGGKLIIREDEKSIDTRIQIYKTETFRYRKQPCTTDSGTFERSTFKSRLRHGKKSGELQVSARFRRFCSSGLYDS